LPFNIVANSVLAVYNIFQLVSLTIGGFNMRNNKLAQAAIDYLKNSNIGNENNINLVLNNIDYATDIENACYHLSNHNILSQHTFDVIMHHLDYSFFIYESMLCLQQSNLLTKENVATFSQNISQNFLIHAVLAFLQNNKLLTQENFALIFKDAEKTPFIIATILGMRDSIRNKKLPAIFNKENFVSICDANHAEILNYNYNTSKSE